MCGVDAFPSLVQHLRISITINALNIDWAVQYCHVRIYIVSAAETHSREYERKEKGVETNLQFQNKISSVIFGRKEKTFLGRWAFVLVW